MESDLIGVALRVVEALEGCGVPYVAGGSVASSICGEPRSTQDVDLVVFLSEARIEPFLAGLGGGFYADLESARRAVRDRASFNVIHETTGTKVDLFVRRGTPWDEEQMRRRMRVQVASDPDRFLFVYTPEDILLQKLNGYRLGREVSDRQWRDVQGIVRVQGSRLDLAYLRRWAPEMGVADLLDRALSRPPTPRP